MAKIFSIQWVPLISYQYSDRRIIFLATDSDSSLDRHDWVQEHEKIHMSSAQCTWKAGDISRSEATDTCLCESSVSERSGDEWPSRSRSRVSMHPP
jgi:hypothetical protein